MYSPTANLVLTATLALIASMWGSGCRGQDSPPTNSAAPPGSDKQTDTKVLEKGAETLQNLAPIRAFDFYLDGFHVMKDDTSLHMEAHHYCKGMNEDFTQCVIFDGNTKDSNMIGLEYIISENLFSGLPADEKKMWHPHNFEILSGQLILPGVPAVAEKAALKKKMNSYGKTWHVWDTGHVGQPAANKMPVGKPLLAWSFNHDGEAPADLINDRDKRMHVSTADKRRERAELESTAKPQVGIDDIKGKIFLPSGHVGHDGGH